MTRDRRTFACLKPMMAAFHPSFPALSFIVREYSIRNIMLQKLFGLCWMMSVVTAFVDRPLIGLMAVPRASSDTALAMGLTLFGSQGSRSPLVNWALYELDLDFKMGDLEENPHPFGQIPCLTDDNNVMVFESGAILIYLNSLASPNLDEAQKAEILSWVAWANASLDPICFLETPDGKVYVPSPMTMSSSQLAISQFLFCIIQKRYDTGLKKPNRRIDKLNTILEDKEFLVGDTFTVADVAVSSYLLYVLQFFPDVDLALWPNMVRYMKACASRPAYGNAFGERIQMFLVKALADVGKPKGLFGVF